MKYHPASSTPRSVWVSKRFCDNHPALLDSLRDLTAAYNMKPVNARSRGKWKIIEWDAQVDDDLAKFKAACKPSGARTGRSHVSLVTSKELKA